MKYEMCIKTKNKYRNHLVIIKSGDFYTSFTNCALILNLLLGYKIKYYKKYFQVTFPRNALNKVENILSVKNISYCIIEGVDIVEHSFVKNFYQSFLAEKDFESKDILIKYIRDKLEKIDYYGLMRIKGLIDGI